MPLQISKRRRKRIHRVVANPADIARYLVEFYNLARSVKKAAKAGGNTTGLSSFEQLVELGRTNRQFDANDQHIVNIVDWLWQYAFEQRASDIHIEPRRELGIVRFRIDGVLHQVYQIPMSVMAAMVSRIKILGRMDLVEKRRPQDGRIKTRTADGQEEIELRLSTLPTAFGEKLVMRIFDPEVLVRNFTELGFSDDDQKRWNGHVNAAERHHSGHRADRFGQDDDALFDTEATGDARGQRVHHRRPDRNGRALVQPDAGADRHRSRLCRRRARADAAGPGHHHGRRNPRSGNCRMAIQAALTGHLVLSTLHTNDAPSA
jgi:general secretion pathway protein E